MPRTIQPILTPTVEPAYERFEAEWPAVWLVYGDATVGWKDQRVSSVYVRIDGYHHLVGDDVYREYRVGAMQVETAIKRAVKLIASPYALTVTVYRVILPPTAADVGFLESHNGRIRRDAAWGASNHPGGSRALGTASRARGDDRYLSSQRRRSVSVRMR